METCYERLRSAGRLYHSVILRSYPSTPLLQQVVKKENKLACIVAELFVKKQQLWLPFSSSVEHERDVVFLEELIPGAGMLHVGRWYAPDRVLQSVLYGGVAGVAVGQVLAGVALGGLAALVYRRCVPVQRLIDDASFVDGRVSEVVKCQERLGATVCGSVEGVVASPLDSTVVVPFAEQRTQVIDVVAETKSSCDVERTDIMPNAVRKEFSRFEVDETEKMPRVN